MTSEILAKAAEHWNRASTAPPPAGVRNWWQSPQIWRHLNRLCGLPDHAGQHAGFNCMIAEAAGGKLARGVSVGCGAAAKEIRLILAGVVDRFDLFEISEARIAIGLAEAEKFGVADRLTWRREDAFAARYDASYDLVHWNNSLHHMLDVERAIDWSIARLRSGGIFAMDDFVGPSRFQWSDADLRRAAQFRGALPRRFLRVPARESEYFPVALERPTVESMIAMDPTEAADSARIVSVLQQKLPHARIIPTGGVIYQLACRNILVNFDEQSDDAALLSLGLMIDQECSTLANTHYAVAVARAP